MNTMNPLLLQSLAGSSFSGSNLFGSSLGGLGGLNMLPLGGGMKTNPGAHVVRTPLNNPFYSMLLAGSEDDDSSEDLLEQYVRQAFGIAAPTPAPKTPEQQLYDLLVGGSEDSSDDDDLLMQYLFQNGFTGGVGLF